MKRVVLIFLAICIFSVPFIPWISSIVKAVQFDANCGGYLTLAADAPNIDIAEKHLSTAIAYLEENDLTHGDTALFIYKPRHDVGLWYENLKAAHTQLKAMQDTEYTELDESNILMKLREVLLNSDGYLTHPQGIYMVENYATMFWLNMLLWLPCWALAIFLFCIGFDEY